MNAHSIMSDLAERKISVRLDGSELVFAATKGALTPEVVSLLKRHKDTLIRHLRGIPDLLEQVAREASTEHLPMTRQDLEAILSPADYADPHVMHPECLRALAMTVQTRRIMESGGIPWGWTAQTVCKRCGPVPIFPGCLPEVIGCPWCFVRNKTALTG